MAPLTTLVILAGGKGERLWPLVRTAIPKVCVAVDGTHSLLGSTLARLQPLMPGAQVVIVTTPEQAAPIRAGLPPSLRRSLLIEPQGKGTAACIALAAARELDPDRVMVVLPADHWIKPAAAFLQSLRAGIQTASARDGIVLIGIRPTRVHPGLGHLVTGGLDGVRQGCRVVRLIQFKEKPARRLAQQLIRRRTTYWNAGMFIGRVEVFRRAIRQCLPGHARRLLSLGAVAGRTAWPRAIRAAYQGLAPVSFDDGVMARLQDGWVVEGRFGWEDLGSWDSWIRIGRLGRPSLAVASPNVYVLTRNGSAAQGGAGRPACPDGRRGAGRHLVATVGLRDAVVVHTPDVTLICRTQDAQAVRALVQRLSRDRRLSRFL